MGILKDSRHNKEFSQKRGQRAFAKLVLFSLLVSLIGPLEFHFIEKEVEAEFEGGGVRASTVYTDDQIQLEPLLSADLEGAHAAYENETTFLSATYRGDFEFDAVELSWEEYRPENSELFVWVRFEGEDGGWSDWFYVHDDVDYKDGDDQDLKTAAALMPTARSIGMQYKVTMSSADGNSSPRVQNMQFHYIDASFEEEVEAPSVQNEEVPAPQTEINYAPSAAKLEFGLDQLEVVTREEWGADPTFLYSDYYGLEEEEEHIEEVEIEEDDADKNGEEPTLQELYPEEFELTEVIYEDEEGEYYWPIEYAANIEKVIVHHTAGEITGDPEATIRAIYYYHAVRRGWGDIGYNYIIANGKIYEGRQGGEMVVGGHAQGNNTGSIGVAVIGNYQYEQPQIEDLEVLSQLMQTKSDLYGIDVDGFGWFRGEVSHNVLGHRDVGQTLCPGQKLYDMLPTLRKLSANGLTDLEGQLYGQMTDDPYAFVSVNPYEVVILEPERINSFEIKLMNIGTETWDSNTYLVANRNNQAEALVHLVKEENNSVSIGSMHEETVEPGETATFTVQAEAMMRGGFESFDVTPIFNEEEKKTSHYLDLPVYVYSPVLSYDIESVVTDSERVNSRETFHVEITLTNTGNVNWYSEGAYPMDLGTANPYDRESTFLDGEANRFGSLIEEIVGPGEMGTFELTLKAPEASGHYTEVIAPIVDNVGWAEGEKLYFEIMVYNPYDKAELVGMSDQTLFAPGERLEVWIELENLGDSTWESEDLSIGRIHNDAIGVTKPVLEESDVESGDTGRFTFYVTAPDDQGNYTIFLRPRLNRTNLVKDPIKFEFTVVGTGSSSETTGAGVSTYSGLDQETMRVKLGYDSSELGAPIITANGDFDVYLGSQLFLLAEEGEEVEVRIMDDDYQLIHEDRAWIVDDYPRIIPANDDTILEIVNYENRPSWNTELNDNRFRGILEVREDDGNLIVINELSMEYYLRGVAEATNSEPIEKQRLMAIIARSYARYYIEKDEKFPGKPYHGSDDPDEFQKYLGYGYEERAPNWINAVEDTAGLVVTYEGELVKTPYFSSTDGTATRSAEEVWGWTHTPYLISVPDPLCEAGVFSGHGVGLSGCGATAAAEAGYSYDEIIKYYYTGVEIEVK